MLRADLTESEDSPLLKKNNVVRSLTISADEDEYKQRNESQIHNSSEIKWQAGAFNRGRLSVVVCVLLVELCERVAYYSVNANLVLFCTNVLELTSTRATMISFVFTGTVYMIPIIGGYVADAWSNRFNVIYGSGLIYFCGLFLLLSSAVQYADWFGSNVGEPSIGFRQVAFFGGLCLVAVGTGGIKSNVGPFGAKQVEDLGEDSVQSFFNWFYFFINVGGLIAFTGVAYIEQNISFSVGYTIPLVLMMLSLFFLMLARNRYINSLSKGSVLITSLRICGEACCKQSPFIDGQRLIFDSARKEFGGSYDGRLVDGVISVIRILPIFAFSIMFWVIYSQMQATYFLQGERMDLGVGNNQIPVAMLNAINTIAVMLTIPVLDRLIYPWFRKMGHPLTHLQRIGIGMLLSACSVFVAGGVEIYRKSQLGFEQEVSGETFYAANVTVFLQIPQFFLIGSAEAFASISGLEFAYTQSPTYMQGAVMGLFLATTGIGSYMSTAFVAVIGVATRSDPWFPDDINDGKVENMFFLFGGMMLFFFLLYLPVAYCYEYSRFRDILDVDYDGDSVKISRSLQGSDERKMLDSSITIL